MLRVGTSKVDITPPLGLDLQGYAGRNQGAQGILDRLYARCVVVESPAQQSAPSPTEKMADPFRWALLSLDVISLETDDAHALRQDIRAMLGTKDAQVTLATTHTHSGPALLRLRNFGDVDPTYFQHLSKALHKAVRQAIDQLQPAFALSASGHADFAVNRRRPDGKGNILLTPYPEGPVDHEVTVTAIYAAKRSEHTDELDETSGASNVILPDLANPVAVVTNYACHPVTLGINFDISADFPGVYAATVERSFPGAVALYLNGTSGDINPPAMDGWATMKACGLSLAAETLRIIAGMQHDALSHAQNLASPTKHPAGSSQPDRPVGDDITPLAWQETVVTLPLRDLPSRDVLEDQLGRFHAQLQAMEAERNNQPATGPTDDSRATAALVTWAKACLTEKDGKGPKGNNEQAPVQTVVVGETAFVFLPGEIFVEYGMDIKRQSPFTHTHVVGYTNGWIGYVPTPDAIEKGGYEPTAYRYWQNRPFAPEAGSLLVTQALNQLTELARGKANR